MRHEEKVTGKAVKDDIMKLTHLYKDKITRHWCEDLYPEIPSTAW